MFLVELEDLRRHRNPNDEDPMPYEEDEGYMCFVVAQKWENEGGEIGTLFHELLAHWHSTVRNSESRRLARK